MKETLKNPLIVPTKHWKKINPDKRTLIGRLGGSSGAGIFVHRSGTFLANNLKNFEFRQFVRQSKPSPDPEASFLLINDFKDTEKVDLRRIDYKDEKSISGLGRLEGGVKLSLDSYPNNLKAHMVLGKDGHFMIFENRFEEHNLDPLFHSGFVGIDHLKVVNCNAGESQVKGGQKFHKISFLKENQILRILKGPTNLDHCKMIGCILDKYQDTAEICEVKFTQEKGCFFGVSHKLRKQLTIAKFQCKHKKSLYGFHKEILVKGLRKGRNDDFLIFYKTEKRLMISELFVIGGKATRPFWEFEVASYVRLEVEEPLKQMELTILDIVIFEKFGVEMRDMEATGSRNGAPKTSANGRIDLIALILISKSGKQLVLNLAQICWESHKLKSLDTSVLEIKKREDEEVVDAFRDDFFGFCLKGNFSKNEPKLDYLTICRRRSNLQDANDVLLGDQEGEDLEMIFFSVDRENQKFERLEGFNGSRIKLMLPEKPELCSKCFGLAQNGFIFVSRNAEICVLKIENLSNSTQTEAAERDKEVNNGPKEIKNIQKTDQMDDLEDIENNAFLSQNSIDETDRKLTENIDAAPEYQQMLLTVKVSEDFNRIQIENTDDDEAQEALNSERLIDDGHEEQFQKTGMDRAPKDPKKMVKMDKKPKINKIVPVGFNHDRSPKKDSKDTQVKGNNFFTETKAVKITKKPEIEKIDKLAKSDLNEINEPLKQFSLQEGAPEGHGDASEEEKEWDFSKTFSTENMGKKLQGINSRIAQPKSRFAGPPKNAIDTKKPIEPILEENEGQTADLRSSVVVMDVASDKEAQSEKDPSISEKVSSEGEDELVEGEEMEESSEGPSEEEEMEEIGEQSKERSVRSPLLVSNPSDKVVPKKIVIDIPGPSTQGAPLTKMLTGFNDITIE